MNRLTKKIVSILLLICTMFPTCAYAAPEKIYQPTADSYTAGIYRFESGIGKKLFFKLLTPDKPIIFMLIEDDNLKYYAQLNSNFKEVEITLNDPLKVHTAVLIGDGELSFTFE